MGWVGVAVAPKTNTSVRLLKKKKSVPGGLAGGSRALKEESLFPAVAAAVAVAEGP